MSPSKENVDTAITIAVNGLKRETQKRIKVISWKEKGNLDFVSKKQPTMSLKKMLARENPVPQTAAEDFVTRPNICIECHVMPVHLRVLNN